jgi:branched-chain amino acid transport system ATP-binding protein
MTILENVMVGAFLRHPHRSDARDVARRTIEFAGLAALAEQPARSLGTPGRKRLEIARVLASEPRLILLDEALAGLTPVEIESAIELVRKIHSRGITLIIVEHIMEVIVSLASRVLVFNQGRTIATGRPRDVINEPAVVEAYIGRPHAKKRRGGG